MPSSSSIKEALKTKGFAGPFQVITENEAAALLTKYDEYEARTGVKGQWRFQSHLILPWVCELITTPALLDAVAEILGPDLLVWYTEFHSKPPKSHGHYSHHQDSTYAGLEPHDGVLTVWIALTESTIENGCLYFLPHSHHHQLQHIETTPSDPTNLLLKGQRIPDHLIDSSLAQPLQLQPGQASFHAFRCIHASGPNNSPDRHRIGLAVRYMATHVRQVGRLREGAVLVRGEDRYGHFDLRCRPEREWDERGLEVHRQEMALLRAQYVEKGGQQERS